MTGIDVRKIIEKSPFLHKWKADMSETIRQIEPDWDDDDIDECLDELIVANLQLPDVLLDNNYTGESRQTNLLSVFDWAMTRKPLLAGNATFYKNQNEAINPIARMLEGFLLNRKAYKKRMFAVGDENSDQYKDLDRQQANEKVLANSYYGASGMPKSAFYSKWSGPSTTSTAQSVISTTETLFEGLLVDNLLFTCLDDCFHFLNLAKELDYEIDYWVKEVSKWELVDRIRNMFFVGTYKSDYETLISQYVANLSADQVTRIYYKFNLVEFVRRHVEVKDLMEKIFVVIDPPVDIVDSVEEIPFEYKHKYDTGNAKKDLMNYNAFVAHEYFMDPNSPPDCIKEYLEKLNDVLMKYVYCRFLNVDRIHKLKYFKRKTVVIVDTDSNILALDQWVNFVENEVMVSNYGHDEEINRFIIVNTLTYFISHAVTDTLEYYGQMANIPPEHRHRFGMKNEFYFSKLVIGRKKKRYMSAIKLREGNLILPYKDDVKGFEFRKATTSDQAKEIFERIVRVRILEPEVPDVPGILHDLQHLENTIRDSILRGEKTYLPMGNAKDLAAYKNPFSQQGVRGALAWNVIYPDNQISFPAKVSILKMNIFTPEDIAPLAKTHPDIYFAIQKKIFNSSNKEISKKGVQVLAIPANSDIPEWCQPYIDYNTVINNIIGQFKGVLDTFGVNCPEVGRQIHSVNRKTRKFSNIVRF